MTGSSTSVAIVTGAAAGIGRAIATALAAQGSRVAVVDIDPDAASVTAQEIAKQTGVKTVAVAADVSDLEACETAHRTIENALGPASILINNAGIMPQQKGWIEELPPKHFERMLAIHVGGAANWARLVLPAMRAVRFGRIVNMASANALLAVPHRLGYVTAKKAILGLTQGLALDCARAGITVNAIAPGYILTDTLKARAEEGVLDESGIAERTPVGHWGEPDDIARAVLFLTDDAASFVTGTTLAVDGGITIRGDPSEDLDRSPFTQH